MQTERDAARVWTRVSGDGRHAAAGMGLGPVGVKPGGGGEGQPYDGHGRYLGALGAANARARTATDAGGGHRPSPLGKGPERGKEIGKYYVLPPGVIEENKRIALVYSQEKGDLMDMEDRLVGHGYSGAPGYQDKSEHQGLKDKGCIPEGTWAIGEVTASAKETRGKGENLIHLVPDAATAERVRAMGRDPNSFFIHAGKKDPNDRSASQGCIIMGKQTRETIRQLQGAKIRVVR